MPTLSKLSDECKKCSNVKTCNNKRMAMCAVSEMAKQTAANLTAPLTSPLAAPIARPYTPITINIGEYGTIDTSLEEIKEKIAKSFMINSINMNCNSNKS